MTDSSDKPAQVVPLTDEEMSLPFSFAHYMRAKLREHSYKGSWRGQDIEWLKVKLLEEISELFEAFRGDKTIDVAHEAADVANLAMMIWDIHAQKTKGETKCEGEKKCDG